VSCIPCSRTEIKLQCEIVNKHHVSTSVKVIVLLRILRLSNHLENLTYCNRILSLVLAKLLRLKYCLAETGIQDLVTLSWIPGTLAIRPRFFSPNGQTSQIFRGRFVHFKINIFNMKNNNFYEGVHLQCITQCCGSGSGWIRTFFIGSGSERLGPDPRLLKLTFLYLFCSGKLYE
jgi:hypothetical protein